MLNPPWPACYSTILPHPWVASVVALNYTHTGPPCQGAYQEQSNSPVKYTQASQGDKESLKYAVLSRPWYLWHQYSNPLPQTPTLEGICGRLINTNRNKARRLCPHLLYVFPAIITQWFSWRWWDTRHYVQPLLPKAIWGYVTWGGRLTYSKCLRKVLRLAGDASECCNSHSVSSNSFTVVPLVSCSFISLVSYLINNFSEMASSEKQFGDFSWQLIIQPLYNWSRAIADN